MSPTISFLLTAALATTHPLFATASPLPSTPNSNPLAYLNLHASGILPSKDATSSLSTNPCAVALDTTAGEGANLIFPNARLVNRSAGFIECKGQKLVFEGVPEGWSFGVRGVRVGGWLVLERGALVERVEVGVEYLSVGPLPAFGLRC